MNPERIRSILKEGEGLKIEFKKCKSSINKDAYETVCAFLNRHGGILLLGVEDNGTVSGIDEEHIEQIKKEFVTTVNNPQKIFPSVYLSMEQVEFDGRQIISVYVPESSQVHKCGGKIFDRNEDGDLDITNIFTKDFQTDKEGLTLAAILLFGKDETILSAVPHHRTDLILRKENIDRYDDRDDVRTNLIESYDRIIAFGQKHLPDPFYLEGTQRISLRDKIFREIASNILIHREYFNAFPAKIIIEKNRIYSENGNKPFAGGILNPDNFSPHPKNPVIARVFKEIGLADELGSGFRNLMKFVKVYSNSRPVMIEGNVFKIIIPLTEQVTEQATEQATEQEERMEKILNYCKEPKTTSEIMNYLKLTHREHFRSEILKPLIESGLLLLTVPDKPNSPKQKYYSKYAEKAK